MEEEVKVLVAQFQAYQQQLQALIAQKESLKLQSLEIERALEELKSHKQAYAYKVAGPVMVRKSVEELKKELEEQKENLELRLKSVERAEERTLKRLKEVEEKLKLKHEKPQAE